MVKKLASIALIPLFGILPNKINSEINMVPYNRDKIENIQYQESKNQGDRITNLDYESNLGKIKYYKRKSILYKLENFSLSKDGRLIIFTPSGKKFNVNVSNRNQISNYGPLYGNEIPEEFVNLYKELVPQIKSAKEIIN